MSVKAAEKIVAGAVAAESSGASKSATGKKVQDALVDMMKKNGAGIPGNVSGFAQSFAKKDAQGVRVLADAKAIEGIKVGAAFASEGGDTAWVSRSADQSHDIQYWVEVAQRTGLINKMSDKYRMLVEVGVWYLDALNSGYKSRTTGISGASDQQSAGLAIMDAAAGKSPNSLVGKLEGFKKWNPQDVERLAGLLASTSSAGVPAELFAAADPSKGVAQVRKALGSKMSFLDSKAEARAFGDALIVLKLADRSRGQAISSVESGADLAKDRLFNGETVIKYRAAQKASSAA